MSDPAETRRTSYQDVLDAPEDQVAEIIGGALRVSPRPGMPSTSVASLLGAELITSCGRGRGGPGGWIILAEPELHLGDDVLVPDLAGWHRSRLPAVLDAAFLTIPPDWVCEVVSPSSERTDRGEKLPIYASHGIGHAWLVHPRRRTVEVFRLHEGAWLAADTDEVTVPIEPFDAIEIDLAALWTDAAVPARASETAADYAY